MEPKLIPRKRKQPSPISGPFTGIYTRSKSQIYLHHNRSGRARSDEIRRRNHIQLTRSKAPKYKSLNDFNDDMVSGISVKDLRARRVFSPASVVDELEIDCKNQNLTNVSPNSEDLSPGIDDLKSIDSGVSFTENSNGLNPSVEDENEAIGRPNGGISNQSSDSSTKLVTNLQKRKKLYKAPYSFSYRRLLPYLMAVEKDDSCFPKVEVVDIELPCKSRNFTSKCPNLDSNKESDVAANYEETRELDDRKPGENGGIIKFGTCEVQNLKGESPNLSWTEGSMELPNGEPRNNEGGRDNGVDDLTEECDQATPPDADIFGKPKLDDTVANNVSQNETTIRKDGFIAEGFSDQQNDSNSKCATVLNPCSRMKLFKTPSSVSYRRLLPFLMDIAKDNSSASTINQCSKLEKDLELKPSTLVLASSPEDILVDKSETECNSGQHCLGDNEPSMLKPILNSTRVSSAETKPSSPTSMLTSCNGDNSKETVMLSSQLENVTSDRPTEMEQESLLTIFSNGHQASHLSMSLCCPENHENFSGDCAKLMQIDSRKDCSALQAGFGNNEIKPITVSVVQNSFQIKGCDSSGVLVDGLRKGILKRNPRGCRGLCNCLNCATFRLHAERAFEFSRNQMLDAEEVALELMKELTDIRNVLEKSVVDANTQVVLRGDQVKVACKKALATEELAKKRLSQMNEDLSFHCRNKSLERPRVAFANNVEEKSIRNGDYQGDSFKE